MKQFQTLHKQLCHVLLPHDRATVSHPAGFQGTAPELPLLCLGNCHLSQHTGCCVSRPGPPQQSLRPGGLNSSNAFPLRSGGWSPRWQVCSLLGPLSSACRWPPSCWGFSWPFLGVHAPLVFLPFRIGTLVILD